MAALAELTPDGDMADFLTTLEEQFYAQGMSQGDPHGKLHGLFEGRALGREKGWELWEEVGYYEGVAIFWRAVLLAQGKQNTRCVFFLRRSYVLCTITDYTVRTQSNDSPRSSDRLRQRLPHHQRFNSRQFHSALRCRHSRAPLVDTIEISCRVRFSRHQTEDGRRYDEYKRGRQREGCQYERLSCRTSSCRTSLSLWLLSRRFADSFVVMQSNSSVLRVKDRHSRLVSVFSRRSMIAPSRGELAVVVPDHRIAEMRNKGIYRISPNLAHTPSALGTAITTTHHAHRVSVRAM